MFVYIDTSELASHGNGLPSLKVFYQMKDANMKGYELYASNWDSIEKAISRGCKGNWCIGRAENSLCDTVRVESYSHPYSQARDWTVVICMRIWTFM